MAELETVNSLAGVVEGVVEIVVVVVVDPEQAEPMIMRPNIVKQLRRLIRRRRTDP